MMTSSDSPHHLNVPVGILRFAQLDRLARRFLLPPLTCYDATETDRRAHTTRTNTQQPRAGCMEAHTRHKQLKSFKTTHGHSHTSHDPWRPERASTCGAHHRRATRPPPTVCATGDPRARSDSRGLHMRCGGCAGCKGAADGAHDSASSANASAVTMRAARRAAISGFVAGGAGAWPLALHLPLCSDAVDTGDGNGPEHDSKAILAVVMAKARPATADAASATHCLPTVYATGDPPARSDSRCLHLCCGG